MHFLAILHNRRGQRHLDQTGDLDLAAAAFERAISYAEGWSVPWYNLGLVRKRQRRWAESLACNLRAAALDSTDEATRHYNEQQLAALILMIGVTNLFNRLNATTKQVAGAAW